jgi:hypothetical protein
MSKGAATLLPRSAAFCVSLSGTLQPTDVMWSVITEISPLLSREKGLALLLLLCAAAVRLTAAAVAPTTAVWYANRSILLIPTISWPTPVASCFWGEIPLSSSSSFHGPIRDLFHLAESNRRLHQEGDGWMPDRRSTRMSKPELLLLLLLKRSTPSRILLLVAFATVTHNTRWDTAVQPSVGRQNRVHWKRPTEPKAIALDWLGSASPSAGRFWKSLPKELSTYTTEIKGDLYDISSTWLSLPPPPQHSMHPICPHATRYSSTCPT